MRHGAHRGCEWAQVISKAAHLVQGQFFECRKTAFIMLGSLTNQLFRDTHHSEAWLATQLGTVGEPTDHRAVGGGKLARRCSAARAPGLCSAPAPLTAVDER